MEDIQQLRQALHSAQPEDWVTAALTALDEPGMSFSGKSNTATAAAYRTKNAA